ncbi:MAG: hypothetical protein ACOZHQ_07915 [Thermodesulfobacteriota bacterium]
MEFVYQAARLVYEPGRGYQHPRSGAWVAEPMQALRGWIAPEDQRGQWVQLVGLIAEFWQRTPADGADPAGVVEFV